MTADKPSRGAMNHKVDWRTNMADWWAEGERLDAEYLALMSRLIREKKAREREEAMRPPSEPLEKNPGTEPR